MLQSIASRVSKPKPNKASSQTSHKSTKLFVSQSNYVSSNDNNNIDSTIKINNFDKRFDLLEKSIQSALASIFSEIILLKKMLLNFAEQEKTDLKSIDCFEEFPLSSNTEFNEFEKKLSNQEFFDEMADKLIVHVKKICLNYDNIDAVYKLLLSIIFEKLFTNSLTWQTFQGKRDISSSKVVDLIQSK